MYEKLSTRVEGVVKLAHDIAREYDEEYVGTEHVLLAISREGTGVGAKVLLNHGATPEKIKEQVDQLIKHSMEETWVFGRLPGSPHFKNVVAGAIEAARQLESKEVCTEHLLLALLKEKGSVAYNALQSLGIKIEIVRNDVAELTT
ncbi:MAG: ATP-dependent Clp protease ATP-binding subunit [Planctomycetes bacterium]|nr:ATP-dependent Clp protease ATP-binding subunit [Planctomycetota bacterium]MCH8969607.1 ATP-dependent Clp protease ATP-binding subunit [Planctomycetota bacterium]